jgi:hypothetical protein
MVVLVLVLVAVVSRGRPIACQEAWKGVWMAPGLLAGVDAVAGAGAVAVAVAGRAVEVAPRKVSSCRPCVRK